MVDAGEVLHDLLEEVMSGRKLCTGSGSVPMMAASTGVVSLPGGIIVALWGLGSPGENPSFG